MSVGHPNARKPRVVKTASKGPAERGLASKTRRMIRPRPPLACRHTGTRREHAIDRYFAGKASTYDEVSNQVFWAFSDDLLWSLLRAKVLPRCRSKSLVLLDAGGGTGRWTLRVLAAYPKARAIIVDRSPEMLRVAERSLRKARCLDRVTLVERDVRSFPEVEDGSVDLLFCFHNVLGFVCDVQTALAEFGRVLHAGAAAALMFANYYHAAYFVCATGRAAEIGRIRRSRDVKFADGCPSIHLYCPWEIPALLAGAGFTSIGVHGFPVMLYPGQAETTRRSSSKGISDLLEDPVTRRALLRFEQRLCADAKTAARGCNLIAFARSRGPRGRGCSVPAGLQDAAAPRPGG